MVLDRPREPQQQQEVFPSHQNPDLAHPSGHSKRKMPTSAGWIAADPEVKRKKRVAKYKMFSVEAKVKDTVRSSCRWIKNKFMAGVRKRGRAMVKVKGIEWNHVIVIKEPEKHGMATLVRCIHCDKEFQGNAMRIRAHLLGNKRQAGVTGCPTVPDEAREELRLIEIAREQTQKKRKPGGGKMRGSAGGPRGASSASDHSSGSAEHFDGKALTSGRKGDRMSSQQDLLLRMSSIIASIDLDTFFEGFGLRPETVVKIKEMGFTAKTLMSNLDELPSLLESINQHHQLTLGEEWGIKGAAKKWQREQIFFAQPEDEKWPESEDTCKEVACIDSEEVTQLDPYPKWMQQQQQQQGQQLQSPHLVSPSSLTAPNLSLPNPDVTDVGPGGSPGRAGYYTNLLAYQANQGNGRFEMLREVDVASQRQPPQVKHTFDHGAATTF